MTEIERIIEEQSTNQGDYIPDYNYDKLAKAIEQYVDKKLDDYRIKRNKGLKTALWVSGEGHKQEIEQLENDHKQYVTKARIETAKGLYSLWREDNSNVGSGEVFILRLEAEIKKESDDMCSKCGSNLKNEDLGFCPVCDDLPIECDNA